VNTRTVSGKTVEKSGRPNQRSRTRKDLLQAAASLVKRGMKPSLEEIAEAALVSRATAYRYFPNVDALLREAALDVALPTAEDALKGAPMDDPVARLDQVDHAFETMMVGNEGQLRLLVADALTRSVGHTGDVQLRQNRRSPLIEAALAPTRKGLKPGSVDTLEKALALIIGTESMIVTKDVLRISDAEARKVRRWAIRALVEAARK
jgi:AcrR family transcriptional regulator